MVSVSAFIKSSKVHRSATGPVKPGLSACKLVSGTFVAEARRGDSGQHYAASDGKVEELLIRPCARVLRLTVSV